MKFLLSVLALSVMVASAHADNGVPCTKPVIPNRQASDSVIRMFNKRNEAYKVCIKKYVADKRVIIEAEKDKDRAKAEQANNDAEAAIHEYNTYSEEAAKAFPAPEEDK